MLKISFSADRPAEFDAIIFAVNKADSKDINIPVEHLDFVQKMAKQLKFSGGEGALAGTYIMENGKLVYALLVGIGEGTENSLLKAGGKIFTRLKGQNVDHAVLEAGSLKGDAAAILAHGAQLRSWQIDQYKTKKKEDAIAFTKLTISAADKAAKAAWPRLEHVAEGVALTKQLVSEPANVIYPESFVDACKPLADLGVEIRVLDEKEMKKLGMGALLGVAQGSVRPPRMLVMKWNGAGDDSKPLLLVGKGVTFDTGGISLKPPAGMEDMKWDMGGAGVVAGTMRALAGRKAKANVIGVCGLVENMPDGNAQRPGDIVTSMSGQTVEVINTDAEGRLVLCDALHWVQEEYDPEYIVDFATLTGAIIVSLAHDYGGMFSNDDGLAGMIDKAGNATGDEVWRMPMGSAFDKMIDSPIADMKNVGPRPGGSITAAQFLKRFINKGVKWAHMDIAGTVWRAAAGDLHEKGATGYGVRLMDRFVADNFEK